MQETVCSRCEEVTISITSDENVCAGLPWRKTCNAATLRKLSSITDFINGCMYKSMHDNCLFRPEPAGYFFLNYKENLLQDKDPATPQQLR